MYVVMFNNQATEHKNSWQGHKEFSQGSKQIAVTSISKFPFNIQPTYTCSENRKFHT